MNFLSQYLKKKIFRFLESRNILKFLYFYHLVFGEKFRDEIKNILIPENIHRLEIINQIIKLKEYKSYLEIGCNKDDVFSKINIKKTGVDPISGGNIRLKSDDFFKINKENFDIIFVDGLHTYTQVRADILNSIKFLNNDGIILVHDCLPLDYFSQAVPRCQRKWNGDVWKAIVEFSTYNYLDVAVINADEGVGIIKKVNREKKNQLLISDFNKLSYEWYYKNYVNLIKIITTNNINKFINER